MSNDLWKGDRILPSSDWLQQHLWSGIVVHLENEMVKIRGPVEPLHVFTNFVSCLVGHDELSWRRAVPRLLKPELFNDAMDAEAANDSDTDGPLPSCP